MTTFVALLRGVFQDRPWRWCLALFAAQFVTMARRRHACGPDWAQLK